jgi:hypothetical protein
MTGRFVYYLRGDALYALPNPAAFDDDRLRLAIALRNQATLAGYCSACGAVAKTPKRPKNGTAVARVMAHEAACPCGDDHLAALFAQSGEAA